MLGIYFLVNFQKIRAEFSKIREKLAFYYLEHF